MEPDHNGTVIPAGCIPNADAINHRGMNGGGASKPTGPDVVALCC